jgi:hypothetical protein
MTLAALQQWVCDELAKDAWLVERRLTFVAESRRDAATAAEIALASAGIFGLVTTPAFIGRGQEVGTVEGLATINVQIIEAVTSNRASAGYASALDAAARVGIDATSWAGALFKSLSLVETEAKEAVCYQAVIEIPIALTNE